jgi:hypothetical protein
MVFMSAHPAELLLEQGKLAPGALYLEKPFEMEAVEELLGKLPASGTAIP